MSKVFCIGVWKTGTTSVGKAANILVGGKHDGNTEYIEDKGTHIGNMHRGSYETGKKSFNALIKDYTTFDDAPWNRSFTLEYLKECPQYKFILSTRNPDEWHYSAYTFYRKLNEQGMITPEEVWGMYNLEFKWVFGDSFNTTKIIGDNQFAGMIKLKSLWIDWFNLRNEKVREMFKGNFLEYNISDGLGWGPLCNYLGKDVPSEPFPVLNSQN